MNNIKAKYKLYLDNKNVRKCVYGARAHAIVKSDKAPHSNMMRTNIFLLVSMWRVIDIIENKARSFSINFK